MAVKVWWGLLINQHDLSIWSSINYISVRICSDVVAAPFCCKFSAPAFHIVNLILWNLNRRRTILRWPDSRRPGSCFAGKWEPAGSRLWIRRPPSTVLGSHIPKLQYIEMFWLIDNVVSSSLGLSYDDFGTFQLPTNTEIIDQHLPCGIGILFERFSIDR